MKRIIIVGAGAGGLRCALDLNKKFRRTSFVEISLIDSRSYHLFHPNLYEVATSSEELTTLPELKKTLAISLPEILRGTRIQFIHGKVTAIHQQDGRLVVGRNTKKFDYLVLAMGAEPHFYGVPGAKEYGMPLMDIPQALRIRNQIEFLVQTHRFDTTKKKIRLVVAGGGFSGLELAAELKGCLDFLAWKNNYPRQKLEVVVVERSPSILSAMDEKVSAKAYERLQDLDIHVEFNATITKVDKHFLLFSNDDRFEYDCLIWTAGIKAHDACLEQAPQADPSSRIMSDPCMRLQRSESIFVIGDQGCFMNPESHPLPATASQAVHQGKYAARAIADLVYGRTPKPHVCKDFGYIVVLGGKWAILKTKRLYMTGLLPYIIRQVVYWDYFASLIGAWKALKLLISQDKIYFKND